METAKIELKVTLDDVIQGLISKQDIDPIIKEILLQAEKDFFKALFYAPS
jgi:hypothetical protein